MLLARNVTNRNINIFSCSNTSSLCLTPCETANNNYVYGVREVSQAKVYLWPTKSEDVLLKKLICKTYQSIQNWSALPSIPQNPLSQSFVPSHTKKKLTQFKNCLNQRVTINQQATYIYCYIVVYLWTALEERTVPRGQLPAFDLWNHSVACEAVPRPSSWTAELTCSLRCDCQPPFPRNKMAEWISNVTGRQNSVCFEKRNDLLVHDESWRGPFRLAGPKWR